MSTQEPDDFPKPGEGTTTVRRMVGARLTDGPIRGSSMPATLLGEVIVRLGKLYSALADQGQNLSRAVSNHPFMLEAPAAGSISLAFTPASPDGDDLPFDEGAGAELTPEKLLGFIDELTSSDPATVAAIAVGMGTAVTSAYRSLAEVLGESDLVAAFELVIDDDGARDYHRHAVLHPQAARDQVDALVAASVMDTRNIQITGVIDELAKNRGSFKLDAPTAPSMNQRWKHALGSGHRSLRGSLSPEGASDARRLNVWGKLVTVDLQITETTAPTATVTKNIDGLLLRVVHVHEPLPLNPDPSST